MSAVILSEDRGFALAAAVPDDLPEILGLMKACESDLPPLQEDGAGQLLLRNIRRGSVLLAKKDARVVGVSIWSPVLHRISYLAVHPASRRVGAAALLLSETLNRMPPGDVTVETFRADDSRGSAAHALYHRFGFREDVPLEGYALPMQRYRLYRGSAL